MSGSKLAGGSHLRHVGDALPGETSIHLNTQRMFDFEGGAASVLFMSSVQPNESAWILKRELLSAFNHIVAPTPINVALAKGTLEAHPGLSDSLAWRTTSSQEWVTKL